VGDSDLETFLGQQAARRRLLRDAAPGRKRGKSPAMLEAEQLMAELERLVLRRQKGRHLDHESFPRRFRPGTRPRTEQ
jgi:hypothetical protein